MKAECTWGEGPDVLVVLDGTPLVCHENPSNPPPPRGQYKHGMISQGSLDLTANKARALAKELLSAADAADRLQNNVPRSKKYNIDVYTLEGIHHFKSNLIGDKKGGFPNISSLSKSLRECPDFAPFKNTAHLLRFNLSESAIIVVRANLIGNVNIVNISW